MEIGQKFSVASIKPVHETRDELSRIIFGLENVGSTALGMFFYFILFISLVSLLSLFGLSNHIP